MTHFVHERMILPVNDLFQGLSIYKNLNFLKNSQWWSGEMLISYQEIRLRNLIRFAYEHVPFYKDWFYKHNLNPSDIFYISDLKKLPVISKSEIRKSPHFFTATNKDLQKYLILNSSGSTGEPFRYLISRDAYSMKYAAALRGWFWMGYSLGDFYAKLSQNKRTKAVKKIQDIVNKCLYIYIPDLSSGTIQKIIFKIEKEKPEFVRCYPDPLLFIAKALRADKKCLNGIKAINCTGNILTSEARAIIEERFCCPVFDSYSCEGSAVFFEGPTRENYLGSMEYAITEVTDNNGEDVKLGEPGMHITTDLWNYTMPLIRYNTQDLVIKSESFSSCGRQLMSFSKIIGRDNDVLITPSGNLLIVHLFTIYFEYFDSIIQFQVEQKRLDEFVFRLVVNETFTSGTKSKILDYWQNFLGKNVKLSLETHDSIPNLYYGKRRFLIRNPEIKLPD
jgi:phenylacetate-CoA ligase